MNPVEVGRRRGGPNAVRSLQSAGGNVPVIGTILEQVQTDHTVIDVIVVDERERQPIGRPYLTVAIDVCSRSLVGMVVTLEAPSAVSVGLCLAHAATDKRPWLESLGVDASWPMSGKPRQLYLDNASEFKSEALRRGCEQHGIELAYRPPGRPHYGGIVERVIGTAMQQVHELPGTTFSNPVARGRYDSERMAMLTLGELEKWLALAVASYHGSIHGTLGQTPTGRWAEGVAATGMPAVVSNPTAFLIDFLPVVRRTLTRTGFVIDHVHYFANTLKPWISRRNTLDAFLIQRDPRDLSRIWVLDPDGHVYVEVPYRTMANPVVSLWEHQRALARLRERGIAQVDEAVLFRMIEQMRDIASTASKTTKRPRWRLAEVEQMSLSLLRSTGVRMLVIDELHNVLAGPGSSRREFLNLLRFLGNELHIPIIGVGTRDAYLAIRSDDQLENRFEPVVLPLWIVSADTVSLLASFAAALPLQRPSIIATDDMAQYLLARCEGTIGELAHLLTAAAISAVESGEESINQRTLVMADYLGPTERRRVFERELL
ncbi:hypothetical protein E3O53_01420 [Cryobacterium sp. TMT2-18-3]|nr:MULTISPECIES: TniB family NTP-binding protein [unclassified Cryobacterium]TFC32193.1 hypothetical protein E3O22_00350 [Cryobacterium sp. TMT2-18-2]TFC67844.1 hypothetical protein E3O53_01420 [Cryobacterium sp. TMT2-18-3]